MPDDVVPPSAPDPRRQPDPPPAPAGPASPEPDGAAAEETVYRCEVCGGPMYERHCKIVCPQCGYMRDCSDP